MPMTPVDRKVALVRSGTTQADIARQTSRSESLVSEVIAGTRHNDEVKRAFAAAVGVSVDEAFEPRARTAVTP